MKRKIPYLFGSGNRGQSQECIQREVDNFGHVALSKLLVSYSKNAEICTNSIMCQVVYQVGTGYSIKFSDSCS